MLTMPLTQYRSPIDHFENDRLKHGRPASRTEILSRHLEETKMNSAFYTHDQILRHRSEEFDRIARKEQQLYEARQAAANPAVRIRHTIGRALIAAGERIRPELA